MLSRWMCLVVLGIMALGPGPFNFSQTKELGSQGWMASPLPQQILEAKSKLNSFSLGFFVSSQPPMALAGRQYFNKVLLSYQTPRRGQLLYLVYSKLQSDGG